MRPAKGRVFVASLLRLTVVCAIVLAMPAIAQGGPGTGVEAGSGEILPLWPEGAPGTPESWVEPEHVGANSVTFVTQPTLTVFRPERGKASGAAMIVAPGGGFTGLTIGKEGYRVAQWLADRGITAFVLKYRVHPFEADGRPKDAATPGRATDMQGRFEPNVSLAKADGLQAMRLVRSKAQQFGIARDRIGFMGFSAGAMTAMNVTLAGQPESRPDFVLPIYGAMPDVAVPADAPPAFVVVARNDFLFDKSLQLFNRWSEAGRPIEFHVYEKGGHGFGVDRQGMPVDHWLEPLEAWLIDHHLIYRKG